MSLTRANFPALRSDHLRQIAAPMASKSGAVLYCRVSTEDQLSNFSLETQQDQCRKYCEDRGYTVLNVFREAASAKNTDRPEFQRMLTYCDQMKGEIAAVVVYQLSRFARSSMDHLNVRKALSRQGITLHSVTEPFDDSPQGKFTETLMSAFAQMDNELRAQRTVAGMQTAMESGKFVHRAPVGFVNASVPGGLSHDPVRAPLIRKAFEFYASEQSSKADALSRINTLGLTNPGSGKPISAQTFDKILRNPVYAGWIVSSTWGIKRKGAFEPIVSQDLFAQVEERLLGGSLPERKLRNLRNEFFPLRVFVRCAACGQGITGSRARGRGGKLYAHYFCRTRGCRAVKFPRETLHRMFFELLQDQYPAPAFRGFFHQVVMDVRRQRNASAEKHRLQIQRQRIALEAQKQRLLNLVADGTISKEDYQTQNLKVGTNLAALKKIEGSNALNEVQLSNLLEFADWILCRAAGLWNSAPLVNKTRIQEAFFPGGLTVACEGFGTASTPLFLMDYQGFTFTGS